MGRRWNRVVAGVVVAILVALCVTVVLVVPSDEDLRQRVIAEVDQRFGIEVTVASVHWQLLPRPTITLWHAKTGQAQPIEIRRLSAFPNLRRALLHRRCTVGRLELDGAVIPTASLAAFRSKQKRLAGNPYVAPVDRVRFRDVIWISRTGIPVPIEGEVDFDPLWRPHYAQVRRAGFSPVARRKDGTLVLGGMLKPRGIEVASAMAALNRRSPVGGKANGLTTVSARGTTAGELGQSLRLLTDFRIAPATVLRFDLDKAIRSAGEKHAGSFTVTGSTREPKVAVPPGVLVGAVAGTAVLPGVGTVFGARIGAAVGQLLGPTPKPPA